MPKLKARPVHDSQLDDALQISLEEDILLVYLVIYSVQRFTQYLYTPIKDKY